MITMIALSPTQAKWLKKLCPDLEIKETDPELLNEDKSSLGLHLIDPRTEYMEIYYASVVGPELLVYAGAAQRELRERAPTMPFEELDSLVLLRDRVQDLLLMRGVPLEVSEQMCRCDNAAEEQILRRRLSEDPGFAKRWVETVAIHQAAMALVRNQGREC